MNEKTLKDLLSSLKTAGKPKTSAYDTQATVTRIEGGTAWVHIPGGVTETPVKLTISAKAGDTVQVRVSGGRAFMVGNASAPPTDDTVAVGAVRQIKSVKKEVEAVEETVEVVGRVANDARETAEVGKAIAEATDQHFWYDSNGAHVTMVPKETNPSGTSGFNSLWNSLGLLLRTGANILAQFGQSAVAFYDGEGNAASNVIAQFGRSGARIGATSGTNIAIQPNNAKMTASNGSIAATVMLVSHSAQNDDVDYGIRLTDEHNRSYVQLTPAVNSDATAFTDYLAYETSMQSYEWRTASSYLQYTDSDGFFWQDNQGNQLASVDNDGFLSVIPKAYTPSWATNQSPANYHCVVSAGLCSFFYQGLGGTHGGQNLICTLPTGAKPKSIVFCPCVKGANAYGLVKIETNGNVYLEFISSTSATARLYFNCSFPVV